MLKLLDRFLDRVTMYRLLIYYLAVLLAAATTFSLTGQLQYKAWGILLSGVYLPLLCWVTNKFFAWVFETPANPESAIITGLILALIITPFKIPHDLLFLTAAGGLAIASKYILAIRGKHIFNPAAVAVVLTSLGAQQSASWWVGNQYLFPLVLVGGLLIVRKIERQLMVGVFLIGASLSVIVADLINHHGILPSLKSTLLHSSLLFLAFVMLTEPATSPTRKHNQMWYGALAGVMFAPQVHLFSLYSTPERDLIVANLFAYLVNPKQKLIPKLKRKLKASRSVVDFIFQSHQPLAYQPGQYMEWTLPHRGGDSRGYRRYFTLASSPTEAELRLGVKFYDKGSSFKKAMLKLGERDSMGAAHLSGDFLLPKDPQRKLAFIAGGIGVTPFRSMTKYLLDKSEQRDIVLLYSENNAEELAYTDVFETAARQLGLKIVYTLTGAEPQDWHGQTGMITGQMIKAEVADYKERLFYISGPQPMVAAIKAELKKLGLPSRQIKTDFFPGYA